MAQHDFSEVSNQISSKWQNETDEEHYIRLVSIRASVTLEEWRPRCCNCDNLNNGKCNHYRMEIASEHKFTVNNCDQYREKIPF